ncbi:MAG TPA: HAD-IA family hydrolase, partial [Candidatus Limnocylindrales bacterium]|nr:HAD-IA family hydrolase [Candidatus Limnocylindrales bacterium]
TADLTRLFRALRDSGRRLALATTDDRAPTDATLRALGIRDDVAALACGDDDLGRKPEPGMVLAICAALATAPERAAVVGDTPADLLMGRAAGAGRVIGVLTGLGTPADLEPIADVVLGSVEELLEG